VRMEADACVNRTYRGSVASAGRLAQCRSVTDTEESAELKWYLAQGDKAAWDYFIAEQSAA